MIGRSNHTRRPWPAWARALVAMMAGAGIALELAQAWHAPNSPLRYAILYSTALFAAGAVRHGLMAETAAAWRLRTGQLLGETVGIGLLLWWLLRP